jgi:putative exporter of polyketide antibiotics
VQSTRRPAASAVQKQPAAMAPVGEGPEPTEVNRRGALQIRTPSQNLEYRSSINI